MASPGPDAESAVFQATPGVGGWHAALPYEDQDVYVAAVVGFVTSAVKAGQSVAIAVPEPGLGLLRAALGPLSDHIRLVDMARTGRNPGRIIAEVLYSSLDGQSGRVNIVSEPIWPGRSDAEYPACIQHEALLNLAVSGRDVSVLCPYDAKGLSSHVMVDAATTHPLIVERSGVRSSERFKPETVLAAANLPLTTPGHAEKIPFDRSGLDAIRAAVLRYSRRAALPHLRALDAELAVCELVANSIVHGGGTGTLCAWTDDTYVGFDVYDRGHISDPLAGRRPVHALTATGGRGLLLVHHLADLVRTYTTEHGTTVRACFAY